MSTKVIEAEGLGKRYVIGSRESYATLRGALAATFARSSRAREATSHVWAVRDIDLAVEQGDVLGVIGSNGAGKTTLLKLITRITEPTTGVIRHRGRIGALLEVGTGFHPELTGRENIYLNGAILGMRKREIDRKLEEIIDFAEVDDFLDTPVKRYSYGMRMRLAFAVAAHLEPEILLVDEVLAVGDVAFQRKCLGKMETVAQTGRTVLFVSHNMTAIQSLCRRVCWIDRGAVIYDGSPGDVVTHYLRTVPSGAMSRTWDDPDKAPGNESVRMRSARVYADSGSPGDPINVQSPVVLEFEYENLSPEAVLNLSLHVFTVEGILVLNAVPFKEPNWWDRPRPAGRFRDRCHIPGDLLNDGRYRVELLMVKDKRRILFTESAILEFDVQDLPEDSGVYEGEWSGVVRPRLEWQTDRLS